MFFPLLFLCILLGGNADVNNDARRELSKLLSSEEAYDGSLVIPITKNSVGEFPDDVEDEVAVGDRRRLFFSDLEKKFEVHLKARELGKLKDGSSSDDKSSEKSSDSSDSKSDKKAAKEAKKSSSKEKEAVKKVAKEAKKENKKAKKKLKQVKKMAKKEAKKALKKIKKELKNAKKATRKEKKQIAKKVTKKILKKINRKMEDAGGKRLRFSDLEGRRRNRRGGCNRCKCKRSCSCDGDGDRCSCRRKCNCKKQRRRPSGNQFQQMHLHFGQPKFQHAVCVNLNPQVYTLKGNPPNATQL